MNIGVGIALAGLGLMGYAFLLLAGGADKHQANLIHIIGMVTLVAGILLANKLDNS